jgi:hypothetical protein
MNEKEDTFLAAAGEKSPCSLCTPAAQAIIKQAYAR